jgi:hypothetical protein
MHLEKGSGLGGNQNSSRFLFTRKAGQTMPHQAQAVQCDFCNMTSLRKDTVVRHEQKYCPKNPRRKTCNTCKHFEGIYNNKITPLEAEILGCAGAPYYCNAMQVGLLTRLQDCSEWEEMEVRQ